MTGWLWVGITRRAPDRNAVLLGKAQARYSGARRKAAVESMKMDFNVPDDVPRQTLNRILVHDARGWKTPYPMVRQGAFAPTSASAGEGEKDKDEK